MMRWKSKNVMTKKKKKKKKKRSRKVISAERGSRAEMINKAKQWWPYLR